MRLQFESISEKIFALINDEFEAGTDEAQRVYKRIVKTMFIEFLRSNKNGK